MAEAASRGHKEIVRLIKQYELPLYLAAVNGDVEIVQLLLKYEADVYDDDALKDTAIADHAEVVKVLLKNGADFSKLPSEYQDEFRHLLPN